MLFRGLDIVTIRELKLEDKPQVDKIYKEFFNSNEYPDFFNPNASKFSSPFVVVDKDNKIILAGGIKTIAEAVIVSDRNQPLRVRIDALIQAFGAVICIAREMKYHQIHAFVNHDERYSNALKKFGFQPIDAELLVFNLGDLNG